VWSKLVVNLSSSVLAAAAGAPISELRPDAAFEAIFQRLHGEASAIAQAHCAEFQLVQPMRPRSGHKPSILQDYERRRPMEIDALVTAPLAFARAAGIATPLLDLLGALIVDKATRAGLYMPARQLPVGS
jgi:2-dehydropantoate 2-reductase